ncbi:MAG: chitobiase/beta-hexosaminidase C-terminal domain-containing protein [Chitinivibrionales bacterium]|nr:chitobiase/beta-hexosaminidase C-terminal domain-containing protein [Chitinivibrionales bacterium]
MNRKVILSTIVLFSFVLVSHAALAMRNLRVEPAFLKPGQQVTIYFEAAHDYNAYLNVGGVFSLNNANWDNADDYLFLYDGAEGKTALSPPVQDIYAHRYMTPDQTFLGWYEYSWKTVVPTTFAEGQILTIIVRGTQQNMPMVTSLTAQVELKLTVEVTSTKAMCINRARMSEKSASDKLVIIDVKPPLTIIANPGSGTHFQGDTTIKLTVLFKKDTVKDATLTYTLDGSDPSTKGTPYTGPITINRSLTLRAYATKPSFLPGSGTWVYIKDLIATKIWAVPDSGTTFGAALSVTLHTNADSIRYTTDGSDPRVNGAVYTAAFTVSDDISVVRGIAFGADFDSAAGKWIYYRATVPKVIATPASMEFTTSVSVTLTLSQPWPGAVIYYTRDGSNPDTASQATVKYNNTPIVISETTTLKAQAFANNALPSPITTEQYTLVFGVIAAAYRDVSGDGAIDRIELVLNRVTDKLPRAIECTNPFVTSDKKSVTADAIAWLDNDPSRKTVVADIREPFAYCSQTGFADGAYGRVTEGDYVKDPFGVSDGVAPVIDKAVYSPGSIIDRTKLTRARDTLQVTFTEATTPFARSVIHPFCFITAGGAAYTVDLAQLSASQNTALFLVEYDGIHGVDFPVTGDSIWIDAKFGVGDMKKNTQTVVNNRHACLIVKPKPVCIVVNALAPFTPVSAPFSVPRLDDIGTAELNELMKKNGFLIIVDFLTDLKSAGHRINASLEVYDALGDCIASGSNTGSGGAFTMGVRNDKNLTQLLIYWKGDNLTNRAIGSGAYYSLLRLSLVDPGTHQTYQSGIYRIMIGAKR